MPGWVSCTKRLDCHSIAQDVRIRKRLSNHGRLNAVKDIYLADWHGYTVVYSRCSHEMYADDCLHGLRMMEGLQGSPHVTQLIGVCFSNLEMVTAYYSHGSADKLETLLQKPNMGQYNTTKTRFQLSLDYVKSLFYLHNSPLGTRVMCDTNDLEKTLSQYLITDDFHLVLNDLDALPEVEHSKNKEIKCGHREIQGDFVAPEQLWPFEDKDFRDEAMPGYDEKIDIWKIPSVVDKLLPWNEQNNQIRQLLLQIHKKCKSRDPILRPSAAEVLKVYLSVNSIVEDQTEEKR
ncbi:protein O-mannose kinase isoform X2 [Nematostella vectensis]|nr:protein O-mannose kinase isoform X2 [Nematostella vectensis]